MREEPRARRVLQVHTRYRQPGGEDQVVEAERRLLEDAGLSVEQVIFDNSDLRESRSLPGDLRIAASTIWSRSAARNIRRAIAHRRPDVVHVHNTFAAASPSVYSAATAFRIPVIQTLHNYRFVCPAGTAFRDGHACTDCVGRAVPWPAVVHTCYRGSRPQSALAATMLAVHRGLGTFSRHVDAYVALTDFQRDLMVAGGLPEERIRVIPNFLEPDPGAGPPARTGTLFVGRLSEEKGIGSLLAAARAQPGVLRVAGAGPLEADVLRAAELGLVVHLGSLDRASVLGQMRGAIAVVLPSICFEGFPVVILEAFASGTPMIVSRIGSLAELVDDGVTGLHVQPGDAEDLARVIRWAVDNPEKMRQMGENARREYVTRFRGGPHGAALVGLYRMLIERRSGPVSS